MTRSPDQNPDQIPLSPTGRTTINRGRNRSVDDPDPGGTLYIHGSVAARSAMHHSMNYRSAVIIGAARPVEEAGERDRALALTIDHAIPGRSATLRPSTRKELAATSVLALGLHEASVKIRDGGPVDEPEDVVRRAAS